MSDPHSKNPRLAALLMASATAFIAATMLIAKTLGTDAMGPPLPALQISFGRFAFAFLAVSAVFALRRPDLTQPNWRLHILRTLCGWAGVTLMFASVAFLPLADATAITFLNPVFAMLLAIPLLGERVGPWRWGAAAIALAGALILIRPTPASFQPAALLALSAAMVMGLEIIIIKRLSGRENPLQILVINNFLGLCIAGFVALWIWQHPTPVQWALLGCLGVLMACAQAFFVNAMARADASYVAPISYATLIFATIYDFLFFSALPDWVTFCGAGLTLSGALVLAWREGRVRQKNRGTL